MRINQFQEEATRLVNRIDLQYSGLSHSDNLLTLTHVVEELGEVARQIYNSAKGRDEIDLANLGEEIADVYILLAKLSRQIII